MALPHEVQVRISSEAAGTITMTPVVTETLPFRSLVEIVLGASGKDLARVMEILAQGAVVQGASRFRWQPLEPAAEDLAALLTTFPDADASRRFQPDRCTGARIHAGTRALDLPRRVASERRLLKRRSFWDELMALAMRSRLEYIGYSYRLGGDQYRLRLAPQDVEALRTAAGLLRYSALIATLRDSPLDTVEFVAARK